jgi:uroporphyrinogen-III decarboxylase
MTDMQMTSRERLLAAMEHRPVDHVPLLLRFWWLSGETDNIPFDWRDEVARVEATTALGLDDTLLLQPPLGYVEDYIAEEALGVRSRVELLPPEDGQAYPAYPLLKKIYETPEGPLQTVVQLSEDWPRGNDIRLFDDYNLSRLKEPLIKDAADLRRLRYLLPDPTPEQIAEFRSRADELRRASQRLGVLLDGGWIALGDAAMWLCGMQRILYGQMDEPDFIEQVLDTIQEWELRRLDLLLEAGIDVLVHMAWYESTDFWSPRTYRKLLRPRLQVEIDRCHARGVKFRYIITRSWRPYRQDLAEMGVDCLTGVDPVQDKLDLAQAKSEIGGQVCLMGGLNSAVMLSQWDDEQIRAAVGRALEIMAPGGGFILYPVDAIFNTQPWEKVLVMIDEWKKLAF